MRKVGDATRSSRRHSAMQWIRRARQGAAKRDRQSFDEAVAVRGGPMIALPVADAVLGTVSRQQHRAVVGR